MAAGASDDVLGELSRREPIFHGPAWPTDRKALEALVAHDFWEVGASGRVYGRDLVLDSLSTRSVDPADESWETSDFDLLTLADDTYAVRYALRQGGRRTRRVTIWRCAAGQWQVLYHQGTVVTDDA